MHCNLRPPDVVLVVLGCTDQICTAHEHELIFSSFWSAFWHRHLILQAWFAKKYLEIRQCFQYVTLTFDSLTLNVCSTSILSRVQTLYKIWVKSKNRTVRGWDTDNLARFRRTVLTLILIRGSPQILSDKYGNYVFVS